MSTRFLHTADWQLGKPFAGIGDVQKRALVVQERLNVIARIGAAAKEHGAEFILIAGDLFDSTSATKATVSAACSAIGQLGMPVLAIPGNHDHGGPGSLWEQPFFQRECASLAPNFRILLKPEPVELASAVILPCPLLRRADTADPTAWLRSSDSFAFLAADKPRIVLAHGSTQEFGEQADDEDSAGHASNRLDLTRFPDAAVDYVALGDWHGMKSITPEAWYAGTPEVDRFPKGENNQPGYVLAVTASRGALPQITPVRTARFGWHDLAFNFSDDAALDRLQQQIDALIGNRASEDLLRLALAGALGIEATTRLEHFLDALHARLLHVRLANATVVAPTTEETLALTQRAGDPLIARVAAQLVARAAGTDESAAIARVALRELHAACAQT